MRGVFSFPNSNNNKRENLHFVIYMSEWCILPCEMCMIVCHKRGKRAERGTNGSSATYRKNSTSDKWKTLFCWTFCTPDVDLRSIILVLFLFHLDVCKKHRGEEEEGKEEKGERSEEFSHFFCDTSFLLPTCRFLFMMLMVEGSREESGEK